MKQPFSCERLVKENRNKPYQLMQRLLNSSMLIISILLLHLASTKLVNAKSVDLQFENIQVNAEYLENTNKNTPFFLILHGTFAWHGMELINALQENLNSENFGSLAVTLSLSENNRNHFFDCTHPILSKHEDAQEELNIWLTWLENKGYKNIHLIGHSRGGVQVAQFSINHSKRVNKVFLIAPMVWDAKQTADLFNKNNKTNLNDMLKTVSIQPSGKLFKIDQALHCSNARISSGAFTSYYDSKPVKNTVELLPQTINPIYIYLGDSDPLTSAFNQYYSKIEKQNHVVIKLIEDADHFFRDFASEDVIESIISHVKPL